MNFFLFDLNKQETLIILILKIWWFNCLFFLINYFFVVSFSSDMSQDSMRTDILLPIYVIKNFTILHAGQERIYIVKTFLCQNWGQKKSHKKNLHTSKHSLMHINIL